MQIFPSSSLLIGRESAVVPTEVEAIRGWISRKTGQIFRHVEFLRSFCVLGQKLRRPHLQTPFQATPIGRMYLYVSLRGGFVVSCD